MSKENLYKIIESGLYNLKVPSVNLYDDDDDDEIEEYDTYEWDDDEDFID